MNDPVQMLIAAGAIPTSPFGPSSRYAKVAIGRYQASRSTRAVPYVLRRFVPQAPRHSARHAPHGARRRSRRPDRGTLPGRCGAAPGASPTPTSATDMLELTATPGLRSPFRCRPGRPAPERDVRQHQTIAAPGSGAGAGAELRGRSAELGQGGCGLGQYAERLRADVRRADLHRKLRQPVPGHRRRWRPAVCRSCAWCSSSRINGRAEPIIDGVATRHRGAADRWRQRQTRRQGQGSVRAHGRGGARRRSVSGDAAVGARAGASSRSTRPSA